MGYISSYGRGGLGDGMDVSVATAPLVFNSTKYPGTCKPSDTRTLSAFKELQKQLNRVAQLRGLAKIGVDGDIGPGTVALASKTINTPAAGPCSAIAQNAIAFAAAARVIADGNGVPASVPAPVPAKPPTLVSAATGVEIPAPTGIGAQVSDAWAGMSTPVKVAAVGLGAGILWFAYHELKKR